MQQLLCIETTKILPQNKCQDAPIYKGEIYNSISVAPYGILYNGVDAWHHLEERKHKGDRYHISVLIELPSQEGQSFRKEETVEIPQKLQPFYEQL